MWVVAVQRIGATGPWKNLFFHLTRERARKHKADLNSIYWPARVRKYD